jgi:hypothetical protein
MADTPDPDCKGWPYCKDALHPEDTAHWLHGEPLCRCNQTDPSGSVETQRMNNERFELLTTERDEPRRKLDVAVRNLENIADGVSSSPLPFDISHAKYIAREALSAIRGESP